MGDLLYRAATELVFDDDGGEVTGKVVPFDEPAAVVDIHPDTGVEGPFTEVFRRGAFTNLIAGLTKRGWTGGVTLNFDHNPDRDIGYATELTERDDGLWGRFGLYDSGDLRKTKSKLATSHRGLSVAFRPLRNRVVGDLVERVRVHIDHVAATPTAAYASATVAAVRHDPDPGDFDLDTPRLDQARLWFPTP